VESRLSAAQLREATDLIVVALACASDERAFTEILRRRHVRVRKFMYHVCRDHGLGDDLAQQVFLTAWQSLHQLRTAAAFDGWLKRIMVTTWLEELRRGKLPYAMTVDPELLGTSHDGASEQLDLDAALARLSPEMRLCIVLSYNEGMTHPEIAELASLPLGTVKSHIARGATRLRQLLAAYAGECQ
jgi:RNA polymerase sigma-70 factor, ECF subfamily